MNVVLTSRSSNSASCRRWSAEFLSSSPAGPVRATVDHYQVQVHPGPGASAPALFNDLRERLFSYDIFPPRLLRSVLCPSGSIAEGTTIVQRIMLGPIALEMAVRVIAAWDHDVDGAREAGFTYVTLGGHPECGVETFRVQLLQDGSVLVLIDARSRPGLLLTRLARPAARAFQTGITRAALRRLARTGHESVRP